MVLEERKTGYVVKRKDDSFFQSLLASALTKKFAEIQILKKENPDEWEIVEVRAPILLNA